MILLTQLISAPPCKFYFSYFTHHNYVNFRNSRAWAKFLFSDLKRLRLQYTVFLTRNWRWVTYICKDKITNCMHIWREGYLLPTWVRKNNLPTFWLNAPVVIRTFTLMTTGAFSQNVGKLFSELKLVTDNLLFICAEMHAYIVALQNVN